MEAFILSDGEILGVFKTYKKARKKRRNIAYKTARNLINTAGAAGVHLNIEDLRWIGIEILDTIDTITIEPIQLQD